MYAIKVIDGRGAAYPSGQPFESESAGREALAVEPLTGRFVRAELWAGHVSEEGIWVNDGVAPIATRARA